MASLRFVVGDGLCHVAHRALCNFHRIKSTKQTAVSGMHSLKTLAIRQDMKRNVAAPLQRTIGATNLEFHGVISQNVGERVTLDRRDGNSHVSIAGCAIAAAVALQVGTHAPGRALGTRGHGKR